MTINRHILRTHNISRVRMQAHRVAFGRSERLFESEYFMYCTLHPDKYICMEFTAHYTQTNIYIWNSLRMTTGQIYIYMEFTEHYTRTNINIYGIHCALHPDIYIYIWNSLRITPGQIYISLSLMACGLISPQIL